MMSPDITNLQIYVRPGITDMRKQVNGLSILAQEEMELNPGSGNLFLFCSRDRKLIKSIYWDRNGFCLWQKRLENEKFPWPNTEEQVKEISQKQLEMLLVGIDFWNAHKTLSYEEII